MKAAESEDISSGATNPMEALIKSMLQQQEASREQLKQQQEASHQQQEASEAILKATLEQQKEQQEAALKATLEASEERFSKQQEASEERFLRLLDNLWSESGQVSGSGSQTTSSTSVNNRNSFTITKLHLKAPPVLEKDTDYRGFVNWRKMFDRYADTEETNCNLQELLFTQICIKDGVFNEHSGKYN